MKVTQQEIVEALRGDWDDSARLWFADRIEEHGIAPPDGRTPVAWAIDTPHGRGYSFAEELLDSYPVPDGMVLVRKDLVEFLCGAEPIDGVWFGEKHPNHVGNYWWRKFLAAAPEVKP